MIPNECVSFILAKSGSVLLETRSCSKATDPGLIAIPGGHIENGENQFEALARELAEELGIVSEHQFYLCSLYNPTKELQLIHYYVITEWIGELRNREAEVVAWYPLVGAPVQLESDNIALSELMRVGSFLNHEPDFPR